MESITRRFLTALALLAALVAGRPAAAQSIPDTLFDGATRAELERIISAARQAGLPASPLINRALQGAARRVDGNRVVGVVRAYADSMRVAQTLLGPGSVESELDAGAAALRAGVSRENLRDVRRTRSAGQATTALIVLTDLVRRGVPAADAASAVNTVAAAQSDNALLSLQSAIARESAAPTPAQLRDAVQRQLRQRPPVPDDVKGKALVRALDGRTSPAVGHVAYLALSALNPRPAMNGMTTALEGGLAVPLSAGLSLAAGTRAGIDLTDSVVMQVRGGLSFMRRAGDDGAVASWLGVESRPMAFAATEPAGADSVPGRGDLENRLDVRHDKGMALVGGASVARAVGRRLSLGALVELESDRIVTRTVVPRYLQPTGPRPDTLQPIGYEEQLTSAPRLFVRSAFNAVVGELALQGSFVHRLSGPRASGEPLVSRSLFTLAAERHIAGGMNLFASMSSREPSNVLGAVLPTDGRVRLGVRLVERRTLPRESKQPDGEVSLTLTLARAPSDSGADSVRVSLHAPAARQVHVEGDFTDWQPAQLTPGSDGHFGAAFPLNGRVVRFRVRVDGGGWQVPPGLAVDVDEFGGLVGVALIR